MNWLARLKKTELAPKAEPTEPTKPSFVGFVGSDIAPMPKTKGDETAANDPAVDPDRWCWPHTEAMNTREIDTFTARVHQFTNQGLGLDDAEALADKLVKRDRDLDDRRLCLECLHLKSGGGRWACNQWRLAGQGAPGLPADLVRQLQRCDSFMEAMT